MSKKVAVNGVQVHYALEGPEGAPVVMMSNSLLTDYGMWDAQMSAFTQNLRVLRYDTRGHGGTQASPGAYSMDLLAGDALGLLDTLGIDRVHFIGLSMGGMIAQRLAAMHGERLLSVVLSDTACELPPASAWDERIALARERGTAAFAGPMTERWLTPGFRERHPEVVDRLGAMIARTSVDGLVGCACAIRDMNQAPLLERITVPTLVVVGEHDVGTPLAAAEVLHRGIRRSTIVVVKQAGHMPNIEQTAFFDRTVLDFIARITKSAVLNS